MKDYKKVIPNILTISRFVFTPIIIILGLVFDQYKLVIALAIISAITDFLDGRLARKWNVASDKGAKLDAIADKTFSICLLFCLVKKVGALFIPLVLEIFIAAFNLYFYYKKTHHVNTLMVGKFKATTLYLVIILSMICIYYSKIAFLNKGFIYATINLQILCLIFYCKYSYEYDDEETLEKTTKFKKNKLNKIYDYELEQTKKIDNLKDLVQ